MIVKLSRGGTTWYCAGLLNLCRNPVSERTCGFKTAFLLGKESLGKEKFLFPRFFFLKEKALKVPPSAFLLSLDSGYIRKVYK